MTIPKNEAAAHEHQWTAGTGPPIYPGIPQAVCADPNCPDRAVADRQEEPATERPHLHPNYDCGGKGHGSDVEEVRWCHDCTPHAATGRADDEITLGPDSPGNDTVVMTPSTPSGQRLFEKNASRDAATSEWLLNDILAIEREARVSAPLDVGEAGWLHPAQCSNTHNASGNCLDGEGFVVGWRDWTEYARLSNQSSTKPAQGDTE